VDSCKKEGSLRNPAEGLEGLELGLGPHSHLVNDMPVKQDGYDNNRTQKRRELTQIVKHLKETSKYGLFVVS
jgi:hypothetical protein